MLTPTPGSQGLEKLDQRTLVVPLPATKADVAALHTRLATLESVRAAEAAALAAPAQSIFGVSNGR